MRAIITFLLLMSGFAFANTGKLKMTKLADNVYQHTSYKVVEPWGKVGASGLVIVDENDAYIIDTPWGEDSTKELINWVNSKGLVIKGSVVSHFHEDASSGIPLLNKSNITTYATRKTNTLLNLKGKEKSSHEISNNPFELANGTIEIFYPGKGHTEDNIVVWLPKSKILFGGCFVKSIHSKKLGNVEDASIDIWPESIQKVISKYPNVEIVVPGHGKVGDANLLSHTAKLALGAKGL